MYIFSNLKKDMPIKRKGYAFLKVIIWKCSNDIGGIFNLWVDRMDESSHILFLKMPSKDLKNVPKLSIIKIGC